MFYVKIVTLAVSHLRGKAPVIAQFKRLSVSEVTTWDQKHGGFLESFWALDNNRKPENARSNFRKDAAAAVTG